MNQRTSPTCRRSCRQYWNNLPDHRKTEILSRREWTTSTSLINLPWTRRLGGRHHLSDNEGNDEADDVDVGEDSDDEEEDEYHWNFMQDIPRYDSDGHEVLEDFVPSDQVDEEDEEDEDYKEDKVDGEGRRRRRRRRQR